MVLRPLPERLAARAMPTVGPGHFAGWVGDDDGSETNGWAEIEGGVAASASAFILVAPPPP
jgi:hypothetical protein